MSRKLNFQNQDKMHEKVKALLSARTSLWGGEADLVDQHLAVCDECYEFRSLVDELADDSWNPYQAQYLSVQKREDILKSIEANRRPGNSLVGRPAKLWVQVLSVFVVILLTGSIWFAMNAPQNDSITTLTTPSDIQRDYDGWEIGVAFDLPESWEYTQFNFDNYYQTYTAIAFAERKELLYRWDRTVLEPGESRGIVAVKNPIHQPPGTPEEQLQAFAMRTSGMQVDNLTTTTIAGKRVAYYEGEPAYNHTIVDRLSTATFFIEAKVVQVHIETAANEDGSFPDARGVIETIIASITPIDYDGWKMWEHPTFNLSLAYPSVAVISSSIENPTTSVTGIAPHLNYEWKFERTNLSFADFNTADDFYDHFASQIASDRGFQDIQDTIPSNSHYSRKLYKVTTTDGKQPLLLISIVAGWSDTPMVSSLVIEEAELSEIEPIFEKVVRSGRTKGLPLFDTGERVSIPSVQHFSQNNFSYGEEMIIDPAELEIEVKRIETKEGKTRLDFFIKSTEALQSIIKENQFSISMWGSSATISDSNSNSIRDESGAYYDSHVGEDQRANIIAMDGAVDIKPGSIFTMTADTTFFSVPGNQDLKIDLAGRKWNDRWEIDQSIYFNGLGLKINEVWLNEEESQLKLYATFDTSRIQYEVADFSSSGNSEMQFSAEGNTVSLSYPMAIIPQWQSFYLIGNIEYKEALKTVFTLDESGNPIPIDAN